MELSKILMDLYDKAGEISTEEVNGVILMVSNGDSFETGEIEYIPYKYIVGSTIYYPGSAPSPSKYGSSYSFTVWNDANDNPIVFPYLPQGTEMLYAKYRD